MAHVPNNIHGFWKSKKYRNPPWVRNAKPKRKITDWPLDCFGRIIEEELTQEQRDYLEETRGERW